MGQSKYPYMEFSGALQQITTPHIRKTNEVAEARNVDFSKVIGAFVRRPGTQKYDATNYPTIPTDPIDKPTLGGYIARYPTGAELWMASNASDDLSSVVRRWNPTSSAWVNVQTGLLPNAEVNFTYDLDEMWVSSYVKSTDTIGTPFTVDSSHNVSQIRQLQFAPAARFYLEFNGSMWAANAQVGATRYRDRIYKSSGPTGVVAFSRSAQTDVAADVTLVDQVPLMTNYTTPLGVVSASSEVNTDNRSYQAFDDSVTTRWIAATAANEWVQYDFGSGNAKAITYYSIVGERPGEVANRGPKSWVFQGSNNGTGWTTLDTQTNVPTWNQAASEKRIYSISNIVQYRYYRLYVYSNQGADYITVEEMELLVSTSGVKALTLNLDSARYVKPGQILDIYEAGTNNKEFTITVLAVDKINDSITFLPYQINFAPTDVTVAADSISLTDGSQFPTGAPIHFTTTGTLPSPLVPGTTYYAITGGTVSQSSFAGAITAGSDWTNPTRAVGATDGLFSLNGNEGPGGGGHVPSQIISSAHGLTVPSGARILGIQLDAVVYGDTGSNDQIIQVGNSSKTSTSTPNFGQFWPNPLTNLTWGGPTSLWGRTDWTPADMNDPTFGASLSAFATHATGNIEVDSIKVTIYYTSTNAIKVATSLTNAQTGAAIDITSQGSGQHTALLSYVIGNKDELWGNGRKGFLTRYWNTDYRNPESADWLKLPATLDATNDITAIGKISSRFFIWTENSMFKYDGQNLTPLYNDVGCISIDSIAYYQSFMVWLDAKGQVWARNEEAGTQDVLSTPIQKTIALVTQSALTGSTAVCVGKKYKLTLGQFTSKDGTVKTLRVVYDFEANTWTTELFDAQMPVQLEYKYLGNIKPHFFDEHGNFWVDELGDDDAGATIPLDVSIGDDNLQVDEVKSFFGVKVYGRNCVASKVLISVDYGDWIEIGEMRSQIDSIAFPKNTPNGTMINIRFTNSSTGDPVEIHKALVYYSAEEDTFRATKH